MLSQSDKFYIEKHAEDTPANTDDILAALGQKDTPKLRKQIDSLRREALLAREAAQARSEILHKSEGGKRTVAVMTAAASLREPGQPKTTTPPPAGSRSLKNCIHKIGGPMAGNKP